MWVLLVLYILIIKSSVSFEINTIKNEPSELTELFLENLKADPFLSEDHEISEESKRFINAKIEKFAELVSRSQDAVLSRTKRSLDDISKFSINITSEEIIPTEYADDIRMFRHGSKWFMVSLEGKSKLSVFEYKNGSFQNIHKKDIQYSTNLAVLFIEEYSIIVAGKNENVIVFQFNSTAQGLKQVQMLNIVGAQHLVLWEQNYIPYLSITSNINPSLSDTKNKKSKIHIYKWLRGYFDLVQEVELFNIKKAVPFNIDESYYLAAVKHMPHEDDIKSYSDILKFDVQSAIFKPYQRLLTNSCTDIKQFTSELHGEKYHFLIVVHSIEEDVDESRLDSRSKSVIYKYEDQYFTPFQSIDTNAVEWQPIQDSQGHAALVAVTKEGLKGFQYDGWHFFESLIISNDLKYEDITSLHTYDFAGQQLLVVACGHCRNTINIFKVTFTYFDAMKELHAQLLTWCTKSLQDLEFDEPDYFVAESLRGDLNEQISLEEDYKHELSAALTQSSSVLVSIEDRVEDSLQSNNDHTFDNDIHADNVIFNDEVIFQSLQTTSLNDFNIDNLIDNVLDITDGFDIDDFSEFNVVVSEKALNPKIINNVELEHYIFVDGDETLKDLVVNGTVTFEKGVNFEKAINNRQNMLLKNSDQEFSRNLIIDEIIIHNLTAPKYHFDLIVEEKASIHINDIEMNNLSTKVWITHNSEPISHMNTLKVKNLDIGGLLNEVSVPVLEKGALKKSGDQIFEKTLLVDSLNVDKFYIGDKLSGKKVPDDFVMVNGGEYLVNQDVNFLKGLKVNKLEVLNSLNNITVTDEGYLDILLTDSLKTQSIPVKKSFDSLILTQPIKLRNKIKNKQMDRINPLLIDNDPYDLDGDVTIEGLCEVQRWLKIEDLKRKEDGTTSFQDVLEKGLKLTSPEVPVYLTFTQSLDLDDTIADRINLLNPHDWLLRDSDSPQIITGPKTFLNNLHLEGPVSIFRLNDVDVQSLQNEVLRVEGDQKVTGVLEVERVVAQKGITSNNTFSGDNSKKVNSHVRHEKSEQEILSINGSLKVNTTKAKNVIIRGLINSLNFSEIVKDIVGKDRKFKVLGQKKFQDLYIDNLIITEKDSDLVNVIKDVLNEEVTLNKTMDLNNDLNVENLNFEKNLNNITQDDFKNMVNMKSVNNDTTIVPLDREYDQITVLGEVFINDNSINGRNLSSIENDTVKSDEDYEFENVRFDEAVIVRNSLHLGGNIENLDLDTIVGQDSESVMNIEDKIFNRNVFINGTLKLENTLNGLDMNKICRFSELSGHSKTLKIEGDVIFVKGPKIANVNGLKIGHLIENLWFVDEAANISGTVRLQNTTFYDSIHVKEFVDENNLELLSRNYFSKSKDQTVLAVFSFDQVTFSNISTSKLLIKGPINGIVIDDLLTTILLQNVTQVFEDPAYFHEVHVQGLAEDTSYTVNDINLKTDVMRYDALNTVTGHKILNNLNIDTLKLNHNIKIQDVDILEWLSNAVLINGTMSITGKKILKDATFKQGLSLRGTLNNQSFTENTIMLIDTPQNITGKKNFITNDKDIVKFNILKVKGLINNMHLDKLIQNQTNESQDIIPNSEIIFNNSVLVKNINIDVINNDVNVTELLLNITKLGGLKHFREKYDNLLDMGMTIKHSVEDQASVFKYFKEILVMNEIYDVFGLKCKDEEFRLLTFSFRNGTNIFRTFEWNMFTNEFVKAGENIESSSIPSFVEQISFDDKDYLYLEHLLDPHRKTDLQPHFGRLLQLINTTTFEPVALFNRNATLALISFILPEINQSCLGFIDRKMTGMEILCDDSGSYTFYWFQTINVNMVYKAATLRTENTLYLFLARQETSLKESSVVVYESSVGSIEFKEKQVISVGADLNGLTAAVIGNVPLVGFSFGPRETTINSGHVSIKSLDSSTQQFTQWQHIPVTAPLGVHFVLLMSFEPLLLVPSSDASAPLQTLRYDGSAGFIKSLKGSALSSGSRIRIIRGGKFLVSLQDENGTGVILRAVIKGPLKN